MVKLNQIAKNNLFVLITFFVVNLGAIAISFLKGISNSIGILLLVFVEGEIVGFLLFSNIK